MTKKNRNAQVIESGDIATLKAKLAASAEAKAEIKTAEKTVQKIEYERELKWKYPEDIIKTGDRKTFRQKSRNRIRRMESHALKITDKAAKEAAMAEIDSLRSQVLVDPKIIV